MAESEVSYLGCSTTSQSIQEGLFCDGVYHCFDRFDESIATCGKDRNRTWSVDYQSDSESEVVAKIVFAFPALLLLLLVLFKFVLRSRDYLTSLIFRDGRPRIRSR